MWWHLVMKYRIPHFMSYIPSFQIPSDNCEIMVSGLTPNERYVFAVAAYTSDGKLIGNGVGDTCRAILAAHPLPVLMTWAFLSQVSLASSLKR